MTTRRPPNRFDLLRFALGPLLFTLAFAADGCRCSPCSPCPRSAQECCPRSASDSDLVGLLAASSTSTARERGLRESPPCEADPGQPNSGVLGIHSSALDLAPGVLRLTDDELAALGVPPATARPWRDRGWQFVRDAPPARRNVVLHEVYRTTQGALQLGARRIAVSTAVGIDEETARAAFGKHRLEVVLARPAARTYVVRVPDGLDGAAVAKAIRGEGFVASAEAEMLRLPSRSRALDDPRIRDQWQWKNPPSNADARTAAAWSLGATGKGVRIAVIDGTFLTDHEDLVDAIDLANSGQFEYDGRTGDVVLRKLVSDGANPHGTEVAGMAAARGGNGRGGCGAAPYAGLRLISIDNALSSEAFWRALDFARDPTLEGSPGPGADVAVSAVGWEGCADRQVVRALHDLVTGGRDGLGMPFCWALTNSDEVVTAQNDGIAGLDRVVNVGATTSSDARLLGGKGPLLHLVAPGEIVLTTGSNNTTFYFADSGCSMAAPLVAGVAALVIERCPHLTERQVFRVLRDSADRVGSANGYVDGHSESFGYGRVNAERAVRFASCRCCHPGG